MLFGPTNAPAFYTTMMKIFKDKWDMLFTITVIKIEVYKVLPIALNANEDIMIGNDKSIWCSKTIIDDILLWCTIQ